MKIIFIVLLGLISNLTFSQEKSIITESYLKDLISKKPPSVAQIESSFLTLKQADLMKRDKLALRLDGEGRLYKSKERLLNQFDGGVQQRASSFSLGLVQPTRYGVEVGLSAFSNKSTNAFVSDAATSGLSFSLAIDLFQDFLGRRTNRDLKKGSLSLERAKLEAKSSLKTFESNVRKIYWSLVANQERRTLLSSLVDTAQKQFNDASRRKKSGVADRAEVARFQSQLTSRKSNLLALNYEKSELLKSLKQMLPALNESTLELGPYNINKTVSSVFSCIKSVAESKSSPMDNTPYDEIVNFLVEEEKLEQKIIDTYNQPQVKLVGELSSVGRDFGYEESRQNFSDDGRDRSSVALQISIPLDGKKSQTKAVSKMLAKANYLSQAQMNLAKVKAFHVETVSMITTLKEILESQKDTNKQLGISLSESRKKFNQGRISLQELISEQDSEIQTKLNEIDSNLAIVNTLIDYFSIFTDTPCDFNRI